MIIRGRYPKSKCSSKPAPRRPGPATITFTRDQLYALADLVQEHVNERHYNPDDEQLWESIYTVFLGPRGEIDL